jgi:hypothetical protein
MALPPPVVRAPFQAAGLWGALMLGGALLIVSWSWSRRDTTPYAPPVVLQPNPAPIARERVAPIDPDVPVLERKKRTTIKRPKLDRVVIPPQGVDADTLRGRVDRIGARMRALAPSLDAKQVSQLERRFLDISVALGDLDADDMREVEAGVAALESDLDRYSLPSYRSSQ